MRAMIRLSALAVVLSGSMALAQDDNTKMTPEQQAQWAKVQAIMAKADTVELYSLNPDHRTKKDDQDLFHGWQVLGKTTVKGEDQKKVAAVLDKVRGGLGARCFDPRHAVRFATKDTRVDLLICYECSWVYVFVGDDQRVASLTIRDGQDVLDAILTAAKVPLATKPKK